MVEQMNVYEEFNANEVRLFELKRTFQTGAKK